MAASGRKNATIFSYKAGLKNSPRMKKCDLPSLTLTTAAWPRKARKMLYGASAYALAIHSLYTLATSTDKTCQTVPWNTPHHAKISLSSPPSLVDHVRGTLFEVDPTSDRRPETSTLAANSTPTTTPSALGLSVSEDCDPEVFMANAD